LADPGGGLVIRIRIDLIPGGVGAPRHLGTVTIANDCTGSKGSGNYVAKLSTKRAGRLWRQTRVKGFPRQRLGVYDLLYRVLRDVVGGRNGATLETGR
jgi:hypothetical protein